MLWLLAWKIGYVSQRHTLPEVFLTCVFAGGGLPIVGAAAVRWIKRKTPWFWGAIWVVVMIGSALPRDFRSLHTDRAGHRAVGEWLKGNGDPSIDILDPFGWTEWYAGRTLERWPNPNPTLTKGADLYVVFEPNNKKSPHSRLPRYDFAGQLSRGQAPIYAFPANADPDRVLVAIYQCKTAKK